MKDFTLKDFNKFIKDLEANSKREFKERIERNKKQEKEENQRRSDILKLRHVHEKVDALIGLYPMTKEKLLEQIELIHNGTVLIDDYGMIMGSTKIFCRIMVSSDYVKGSDRLYDYYLTEVKPYIFSDERRKD